MEKEKREKKLSAAALKKKKAKEIIIEIRRKLTGLKHGYSVFPDLNELDTPEKICSYMKEHFNYKENLFYNHNPYELWLTQEGDCNDLCTFAIFVADYHNYETHQIHISFKEIAIKHVLGVYTEDKGYTYSDNEDYCPLCASSFNDIISHYFIDHELELKSYEILDYKNNLIEEG
ncbi:unnamed protein product [marine sediment metagenome]|uniref:Transglutaminase-like domain-containing protein n=1 Tax=marine sediment metagenome TaxID=412755 RepID=X1S218_9ZZZZ